MRLSRSLPLVLSLAIGVAAPAVAQAPAHHGEHSVAATCRDGTRSVVSGRGACTGHGGVRPEVHAKPGRRTAKGTARSAKATVKPQGEPRGSVRGTRRDESATKSRPANAQKPHARKVHADKRHADRAHVDKGRAEKPHAEKPHAEKPHASKPHASKAHADKPHASKSHAANAPTHHADSTRRRSGLRQARSAQSEIRIAREGNPVKPAR